MLYKETVAPATLGFLKKLMNDEALTDFILVGGTAMSLQIGHRISVDLDFFINTSFDEQELSDYLISEYRFELDFIKNNTLKGEIEGIQIDCISHQYPWLYPPVEVETIRMAGLQDITAMKLNAISGNGTRIKDFIDVAYLSTYFTFSEMLDLYEQKYKANRIIALKSLIYFDEINFNEPIRMIEGTFNWGKISDRLVEMQKYPDKKFPPFSVGSLSTLF